MGNHSMRIEDFGLHEPARGLITVASLVQRMAGREWIFWVFWEGCSDAEPDVGSALAANIIRR